MAQQIIGNDAVTLGERGALRLPDRMVETDTMEEEDRSPCPGLAIMRAVGKGAKRAIHRALSPQRLAASRSLAISSMSR
jgi:hypothetical protein